MRKLKLSRKQVKNLSVKKEMDRKKANKKKYRVRNWKEYNESLVQRGSLDFWVEQGIIKSWKVTVVRHIPKKRGKPMIYTNHAIETVLMLGKVFHQRLRQAEGFARSVFQQAGLSLEVPDFTTLSRRGKTIPVVLPKEQKDRVIAILDSTGLKVFGEGEWKVRQHGYSKRRTWVKLHLSVDHDGEIRVVVSSDPSMDDAQAGIALLKGEEGRIDKTINDGGYDKQKFYAACQERHISSVVIPPREGARIWQHGNRGGPPLARDANLRLIRQRSRRHWRETSGYYDRARVENTMFRYKTIMGDRLSARLPQTQQREVLLGCKILNLMRSQGMPRSYAVI